MNTELVTSNRMPFNDIMTMARTFAESGMFTDAKQMGQAFVKIQAGQEIGIPPFAAMSGIHIIQGKPTIGAGLIASTVKGSGKYDYKVLQMDEKVCSIDFYQGKEKLGNSTFTIEDARKAQTKNLDKFPKNMLFARAISNGVKWYTPDVFAGPVYTPEEMDTIDVTHTVVDDKATDPSNPVDYENSLRECGSLDDLTKAWTIIPKYEKPKYLALKDQLKANFDADATPIYMPDADYKAFLKVLKKNGETELVKKREFFDFTAEQETEIANIIAGQTNAA
ncbi:hypothetical protein DBR40_21885 [Pedobacter sp. KBW01]|uniref:hypothetical protein n=1 Tax=Pedobacter sp. KBW01 TaxID=2153364 RepID=UPI000F5926FC|nr:hypothetical protein [Pedobacter sp. KBW01]RQO66804.1 hypothetical protein DBR40_21885 [Pedobacter sp. KBW01]